MKFPLMKRKCICPKTFMGENFMHEIVYSPVAHEDFWRGGGGQKVIPGAKYSFSRMELWFPCTEMLYFHAFF